MRSKASIRKDLDSLWYWIQRQRNKHCLICGDPCPEQHHLISKSHHLTAWDIQGGVGLCPEHHRTDKIISAHNRPPIFLSYLQEYHLEHYTYIIENENKIGVSLKEWWYADKLKELKAWKP